MKKNFVLGLLLLCSICFANEQKTVLAKRGAILEIYSASLQKVRPGAEEEPIAVVVDKGNQFCHDNITRNSEVAKYRRQYLFKVWKGYVTIPADGTYVISLSYNYYGLNNSNTILEISQKPIMFISQVRRRGGESNLTATQSIRLSQGSYEFKIIHRSGFRNDTFTLKIWNKKRPLRKMVVTPANMVHVE